MDVALLLAANPVKTSPSPTEDGKPLGSLRESIISTNKFRIFYKSPMPSTSKAMIKTGCPISFKWEKKFGCNCRKNAL
jgi:hypothetical protein